MLVSNAGKNSFLHKQCIFIGKRSISIHTLYEALPLWEKGGRAGVSKKTVKPSFCHKQELIRNKAQTASQHSNFSFRNCPV